MKFYITKYWASRGIIEVDAIVETSQDGKRKYASGGGIWALISKDAFEYEADANRAVADAANRKLKSLERETARVTSIRDASEIRAEKS